MARMTLDQVAARMTKAKNNRVKRELPLLAATGAIPAEMLVDEAQERARLQKAREDAQKGLARLDQQREETRLLALRCQAEVHELVSEERYQELVDGTRFIAHNGPEYHLDYWRRQLARLDPKYCPHFKRNHDVSRALGHDTCPVCGQHVEL